jgi:membrane associated rhomboid family serine protease
MTPELLVLLAASMVALQIVTLLVRRDAGEAPYLGLLLADLALLLFVHFTHRQVSLPAFVGEAVAAVLVFAPRFLDGMERRALARDDVARAARVAGLRELLVPGRSARRRRRFLADLGAARDGRAAEVIARLRDELKQARAGDEALTLHEELATVLLFEQRFAEGVSEVEGHLGPEYVGEHPVLAAHLVRAWAELGDLERAARALRQLEEGPASRDPQATLLLLQARLMFLAFAGATERIDDLLDPKGGTLGQILPPRAQEVLRRAARSRTPPESPALRELVDQVAARANAAVKPQPRPRRRTPATWALLALNFAAYAVVLFLARDADEGALVRAGALFRPAIEAGQWWRPLTAMFLHAGPFHILINMYGLFLLGRFVEDVFGSARYLVVYLGGGLIGGLASTLVGQGALSVGASGAIMGLLGALIVTLLLKRGTWPEAWRRTLLTNLLLLGGMQIYIGFQVPMIDNAAHVGGLLGGAAFTLLAAPGGLLGDGRAGKWTARALAVLLCAGTLAAGVLAARTSLDATLRAIPVKQVTVGGKTLEVPSYWQVDTAHDRVEDPLLGLQLTVEKGGKLDSSADDPRYRPLLQRIEHSATMKP